MLARRNRFLRSLASDFDFDSIPTVGLGQETFEYDGTKLKVYDLSGSPNFRSVWQRFFAEIWGFVYVVDASDRQRFEESRNTLSRESLGFVYVVDASRVQITPTKPRSPIRRR
jgi:signal recognition particle receptor subunit beta